MSKRQTCEGVWRNRCGQRLYITEREPLHGQRWTDGLRIYSDDGSWALDGHETTEDLVEYIGPLPDQSQRAPVSRPAETESTTARYISTNEALDEKTAEIHRLQAELQQTQQWRTAATDAHSQSEALRIEQATEIERLKAEWRAEFNAAQQLRSEVAQLERLLGEAREELQQLQADQAADEQHSEGERAAYLGIIKALWECERATS